ncbi:polysaccharide deacetylase family protein [Thiovibrio sp. JS02]
MQADNLPIPVIMYHTVGRVMEDWKWSFLTVPKDTFADHLKWLKKYGYRTIDIDELQAHVRGERPLPRRSVFLTFDDGYVDNWTYVAPLLERYGFKGTVFMNPDFVDPRDIVRPNLHDVWDGKIEEDALETRGFMSWPELKLLAGNGPLSVHSHAMTHTWYPISAKIVDFHHPGDGYYWLDWNRYPEKKPFYLLDPSKTEVPYGVPVYEHEKALGATRYFPTPEEEAILVDFVKQRGGAAFFNSPDWRQQLMQKVEDFRKRSADPGRSESPEERNARYRFELVRAREILEDRLGKKVHFLCWPGGGYDEASQEVALNVYAAITLSSRDVSAIRNRVGDDPKLIKRFGVPGIVRNGKIFYPGGRYLVRYLEEYQGSLFSRRRRQVLKALALVRYFYMDGLFAKEGRIQCLK